ncbi:MAG: hypothetical protein WBP42_02505 [Candidatus Zixiibacteriota bacterium]
MNHKLSNGDRTFIEAAQSGKINHIAKKYAPDGKVGDKLRFYDGARCVAVTKISRIEEPTILNDRWLVYWEPQDFQLTK